ncbi:dTDP-4-dehydrorhamnose 3,5-epimerase [Castellaniella sp.]|uniref:dTDP-4-dehydrorhamnose 3,5-epimerase n=1 Tax=Castellaniella sp. TaxID=1955812 RepID=UPI00356018E9
MKVIETALAGVLIIEPTVFTDARGCFMESFSARRYSEQAGITQAFVQDNLSRSRHGVLRGLHFQQRHPQGKLVSVVHGRVYDVVVDITPGSPSFGRHLGLELSDRNRRQLWVPPGFAHGFCVLSDWADQSYKCTQYYDPDDEAGLAWNCPEVAIDWPIAQPLLSPRDQRHPTLSQLARTLPFDTAHP